MSLSRRAKLEREAPARVGPRKAPPVAEVPVAEVPAAEVSVAEPVVAEPEPTAPASEEAPKRVRFVREVVEKPAAAKPVPLPPRSTKVSGKLMSKNMAAGGAKAARGNAATRKGPPGGREAITNTPKR